jgi:regulator of PEP synthase PpsR (kinase-PPPase family)
MRSYENYMVRINAVNYALSYDDGVNPHEYASADIILLGVSRCGKTPTCLYLALQFGIFAANYPLTEEDFSHKNLPDSLAKYRSKLFGLTIEPLRLHKIRNERRPNSDYSNLKRCEFEIAQAISLYRREQIPYLDTTARSIEEISTQVINIAGVKRRLY